MTDWIDRASYSAVIALACTVGAGTVIVFYGLIHYASELCGLGYLSFC